MKRETALILFCLTLSFLSVPASAQDDYALFREAAGNASLLYRGQRAFSYEQVFNGTFYAVSPDFRNGSVVYGGRRYDDVLLNIDAARQELLVRLPGSIIDKVLDGRLVEEFTIDGQRFVNLQYSCGPAAPAGYWAVLYDGNTKFLRRVSKTLENDVDGRKSDLTGYDGPYRRTVYQVFVRTFSYCCLQADGQVLPLRRRNDLLKTFDPALRREVRRMIRRREGNDAMPFERYCTETLKYVESR